MIDDWWHQDDDWWRLVTPMVHAWVRMRLRRQVQMTFFAWYDAAQDSLDEAVNLFTRRCEAWRSNRKDGISKPPKQGRPPPLTLNGLTAVAAAEPIYGSGLTAVTASTLIHSKAQPNLQPTYGNRQPSGPGFYQESWHMPSPAKKFHGQQGQQGLVSATLPEPIVEPRYHGLTTASQRRLLARRLRHEMALIFFAWTRHVEKEGRSRTIYTSPVPPQEPAPWKPPGLRRGRSITNPTTASVGHQATTPSTTSSSRGRPQSASPAVGLRTYRFVF